MTACQNGMMGSVKAGLLFRGPLRLQAVYQIMLLIYVFYGRRDVIFSAIKLLCAERSADFSKPSFFTLTT